MRNGRPVDHIAVQYTWQIDTPDGGVFTLRLTADDLAHVYIDRGLILDAQDGDFEEAQVPLSPGVHSFEVQYLNVEREDLLQVDRDQAGPLPEEAPAAAAPTAESEAVLADPEQDLTVEDVVAHLLRRNCDAADDPHVDPNHGEVQEDGDDNALVAF